MTLIHDQLCQQNVQVGSVPCFCEDAVLGRRLLNFFCTQTLAFHDEAYKIKQMPPILLSYVIPFSFSLLFLLFLGLPLFLFSLVMF